jgi:DNA polymerase
LNQRPLLDKSKKGQVFWVGLSAVQMNGDQPPLSYDTRSGALVGKAEEPFVADLSFYRTNVVKCLPLRLDKIRYPSKSEMEKCYPNLEDEIEMIQPSVVFLLGKQASDFVMQKQGVENIDLDSDFDYQGYYINGINFVPIHHPSYILVYKRKYLDNYIQGIQRHLHSLLSAGDETSMRNRRMVLG